VFGFNLSLAYKFTLLLQNCLNTHLIEAGLDEAGRGCYAGPVFAAAVVLPKHFAHPLLNDSKQLKEADRNKLRLVIEQECIAFAVAQVSHTEIDATNILKASIKAMHKSVDALTTTPEFLLIDGNRFIPYKNILHKTIVKGDATYANIAAASILAKTYRDEFMLNLHNEFPEYGWHKNKGYGTLTHRHAIEKYGLCKYHRKSFNIVPKQISIF
jgi:ribonuclease HII